MAPTLPCFGTLYVTQYLFANDLLTDTVFFTTCSCRQRVFRYRSRRQRTLHRADVVQNLVHRRNSGLARHRTRYFLRLQFGRGALDFPYGASHVSNLFTHISQIFTSEL